MTKYTNIFRKSQPVGVLLGSQHFILKLNATINMYVLLIFYKFIHGFSKWQYLSNIREIYFIKHSQFERSVFYLKIWKLHLLKEICASFELNMLSQILRIQKGQPFCSMYGTWIETNFKFWRKKACFVLLNFLVFYWRFFKVTIFFWYLKCLINLIWKECTFSSIEENICFLLKKWKNCIYERRYTLLSKLEILLQSQWNASKKRQPICLIESQLKKKNVTT